MQIFEYNIIDSTNEEARRYANGNACISLPALFISDEQTAGRGRMGRSFFSPASTGLYASLLIEPPHDSERLLSFTALAAVAAMEAIRSHFGINVSIKWVNDLYLGTKKVAGILAESFVANGRRLVVIGIGINLSTAFFPEDLTDKACSLSTSFTVDPEKKRALALDISERLIAYLASDSIAPQMQKYREGSCVIGREITFLEHGKETRATALDVTDTGGLVVKLGSGKTETLTSGEISIFFK